MRRNLFTAALLAAGLFFAGHANALELDADSVYQIGTAQDLVDFAALVNDNTEGVNNTEACAVLTADIDLNGVTWTPIGNGDRKYKGTFNGQFHSIKNMVLQNVKEQGLFGVCESATIKYVLIDSSCQLTTEKNCTSAFVGCCNGSGDLTLIGCVNCANVRGGKANNSAFVGCNYGSVTVNIIYCVNYGSVSGGWENGVFSGWFGGRQANVYGSINFGAVTEQQGDLTLGRGHSSLANYVNSYDFNAENNANEAFRYADFSDEVATSGKLCYELNCYPGLDGWFQNLGEDEQPTLDPTHKKVYATGSNYCDGTPKAAYTYTNDASATVTTDPHEYVDGYCKNCGAADPDFVTPDADGLLPIGTVAELLWYADLVNGGKNDASAKLTADIDLAGVKWPGIGSTSAYYCGTFDGQYHRIKNLVVNDPDNEFRGFFNVASCATIKHLFIDSSCSFTALKKTAAFVGATYGEGTLLFEGCGNEANVTGISDTNGNNAAYVGCNLSSGNLRIDIKYCYNTGNIGGGNENGIFSGWFASAGSLTGCFNTGVLTEGDGYNSLARGLADSNFHNTYDLNDLNLRQDWTILESYTSAGLADGSLCFTLNGNQEEIGWYQTIGTDAMPTPNPASKQVYGNGNFYCDGQPKEGVTFSNTPGTVNIDPHNYKDGFCDHCGKADPAAALEKDDEGYYHITCGSDLNIFAALTANDGTLKCKFDADIDMDGIAYIPIGSSVTFTGEIDGQQHKISNLYVSNPGTDYQGLVGKVGGGFVVRNLILDETCYIEGKAYSAGFVGGSDGGGDILIENCGNEATVTGTGANIAGIIGVNMGSAAHFIIKNCYNTGTISGGNESACLSGWLGDAAEVTGFWNSGVCTGIQDGYHIARYGSAPTFTNAFALEGTEQSGMNGTFTDEDLESGELCYYLNDQVSGGDSWFQTLGTDFWPVPFSSHGKVYTAGTLLCDGSVDPEAEFGYSNDEGTVIIPDHEWHDGICDNCGLADPDYKQPAEDGWYELADEKDMCWFSGLVKAGVTDAKARLTADIDLGSIEWRPIGSVAHPFNGTFDGQGFYIDNMEAVGTEYVGLFGVVTGGADIKNFIVTGSVTGVRFLAGVAGGSNGTGVVKFTNIGNEATVTGEEQNCAGIVGVSMSGGCAFLINNCYNAADITGGRESAAFSGWMGKAESEINNCYNIGFIAGYDDGNPLYRCACQVTNLVSTNEDSMQGIVVGEDAIASGELAFFVNGKQAEGTHFFQTLGEDEYPVPFSEGHKTVYASGKLLCDGSVSGDITFSNEPGEFEAAQHEFGEDGCCIHCGNAWGISTAQQLLDFSWGVQSGSTQFADAVLLNDIDLDGVEWEPIGYGGTTSSGTDDCVPFGGKFDGQGHKIFNMVIDDQSRMFLGFFGCLTGGAEVRNLIIDKSCYVHGNAYCAGFAGGSKLDGTILFENCGNECNVICDGDNGANAAGFVGCNMNSSATFVIRNCFNTGDIKGALESASFSGWLGSNARVTNCWNTGTIEGIQKGKPFARFGSASFFNCFDLAGTQDGVERLTASAVSSGELCYKLNEGNTEDPIWRQTIGTDPYPAFYPTSLVVYKAGYEYTNDPDGVKPVIVDNAEATVTGIYTLQGVRTDEMQPGINIVRMSNGTVRKVFVK